MYQLEFSTQYTSHTCVSQASRLLILFSSVNKRHNRAAQPRRAELEHKHMELGVHTRAALETICSVKQMLNDLSQQAHL